MSAYLLRGLPLDIKCHIQEFLDRGYFRGTVLPMVLDLVRNRMIDTMWRIMYHPHQGGDERIRNLRTYIRQKSYDLELLLGDPDFVFKDRLYFNREIVHYFLMNKDDG